MDTKDLEVRKKIKQNITSKIPNNSSGFVSKYTLLHMSYEKKKKEKNSLSMYLRSEYRCLSVTALDTC